MAETHDTASRTGFPPLGGQGPRRREPKRSATAPAIGTTSGDLADPRRTGRPAVTAGTAIGKTQARTRAEAARIAETHGRL
ncbi:hypothetical protein ACF07U_23235 [Streptomyces californicus]|uniref:hypothetical protein n=1 Tax=Streptomyces californicus TaxID=67351 RepID=UPI0036FA0550